MDLEKINCRLLFIVKINCDNILYMQSFKNFFNIYAVAMQSFDDVWIPNTVEIIFVIFPLLKKWWPEVVAHLKTRCDWLFEKIWILILKYL